MPLPLTALGVAEVIHQGNVASAGSNAKKFAFVWHFERAAVINSPDEVAVANGYMSNIGSLVMAALNARATTTNVSVRFMDDPLRPAVMTTDTTAGAITGDSLPMEDSAYLLFKTQLRGKSYRGAKHLFPMSESDTTTTSDLFNTACITRLGAIVTAALAGFTDASPNTWRTQIYSRRLSNPLLMPAALVVVTPVTSGLVRKSIGNMIKHKIAPVY